MVYTRRSLEKRTVKGIKMTNYILRRFIQMLFVMLLLSFVCYVLLSLMPGDPLDIMLSSNPKMTAADVARLKALYGLDQPLVYRYFNWLKDILSGDLGYSRTYKIPTIELIVPKLMNTFYLGFLALTFSLLVSLPLGVLAALKKNSKFDYFINLFSFFGISMPSFWLGIVLIIVFSVTFQWLPAGGTSTVGEGQLVGWDNVLDRLKFLILPVLSLSLMEIGAFVRYTRSAMLEVLGQDYIRTAKAKGLRYKRIIFLHAFKNALIPLITVISLNFSYLFSGAIITETVFAYQGVGKLVYDSIIGNDYNVAMVAFMISVMMVLVMNLIADLLYGLVDPRISYS
jgi:peptide/nickel transport system permease protein